MIKIFQDDLNKTATSITDNAKLYEAVDMSSEVLSEIIRLIGDARIVTRGVSINITHPVWQNHQR